MNILGPMPGYTPMLGTLVSEMTWMRQSLLRLVSGITQPQLDFLLDAKANRIGALLHHLAATERYYQLNTFDGLPVAQIEKHTDFAPWVISVELGDAAREVIQGHDVDYYLKLLKDTREFTLAAFRDRDDEWLLAADPHWPKVPTNILCKWFHVCEHESHHAGQIKLLKDRA